MTKQLEPHPIALLFPEMTAEEEAALEEDMRERIAHGVPPLEHPILIYEDKILDGRHRYKVWRKLAIEGDPPQQVVSSDGTLEAWMKAKSLNMIRRHIPADQKAAVFLKAVDAMPELKCILDQIEEENAKRKAEGKPLDAGDQRGNTAKQIGGLVGVGSTTVKAVKKLKKEAPDKFEEVAKGKTSAKKAVKEITEKKKAAAQKKAPAKSKTATEFKAGDKLYRLEPYQPAHAAEGPHLRELVVEALKGNVYVCKGGENVPKSEAFTLDEAKLERKERIQKLITERQEEVMNLKQAVKQEPTIVPIKAGKKAKSKHT